MKILTIICESVLEERVVKLLRECGAQGHTAFQVRGSGHQGERHGDMVESGNVQIEAIVKPAVSESILHRLHHELFPPYAMIAYESDVRVLRPEKF